MKLIRNLIATIAGVAFIFLALSGKLNDAAARLFSVFSNDPESSWVKGGNQTDDVEEEEDLEEKEAAPTSDENEEKPNQYFYVGDVITFINGVTVTVVDAGKEFDGEMNETYAYVELDIDNQSDADITPAMYYTGFYGDDYSLDLGFHEGNIFVSNVIAKGRKGHGSIYAECSDYDALSKIEMEFGDAIIVVKDGTTSAGASGAGRDMLSLTYGTYVYDDGSSLICTANVGISTDDGSDYIYIDCRGYGGHGYIEFLGYLVQNPDGSYTATCTDYDAVLTCSFDEQGMSVKVESTEYDSLDSVEGYYGLESVLDLSNVG